MPSETQMTKFFYDWVHRKQGGLHDEKWVVDLVPEGFSGTTEEREQLRDRVDQALMRIAWRCYIKGKRDGKRGYSEWIDGFVGTEKIGAPIMDVG